MKKELLAIMKEKSITQGNVAPKKPGCGLKEAALADFNRVNIFRPKK
jgi:hypothetical protein